ncbi:MAG: DUF4271 domain-containing protein [Chitinophagaceae bacterium]
MKGQSAFVFSTDSSLLHQQHEISIAQAISHHPTLKTSSSKSGFVERPHVSLNKSKMFFLVLLGLLFFGFIKNSEQKHIQNVQDLYKSIDVINRQMKEQLLNNRWGNILLHILFFMGFATVVTYLLMCWSYIPKQTFSFQTWIVVFAILIGLYILKSLFIRLIAWVANKKDLSEAVFLQQHVANEFIGFYLFPLSMLLLIVQVQYGYIFSWFLIVAILFFILVKYIKIFININKTLQIDFFQFLLYLCSFEILPLILIVKWAT